MRLKNGDANIFRLENERQHFPSHETAQPPAFSRKKKEMNSFTKKWYTEVPHFNTCSSFHRQHVTIDVVPSKRFQISPIVEIGRSEVSLPISTKHVPSVLSPSPPPPSPSLSDEDNEDEDNENAKKHVQWNCNFFPQRTAMKKKLPRIKVQTDFSNTSSNLSPTTVISIAPSPTPEFSLDQQQVTSFFDACIPCKRFNVNDEFTSFESRKHIICRSVFSGTECKYSNCIFAHNAQELTSRACKFGGKCDKVKFSNGKCLKFGNFVCFHRHPCERREDYFNRIKSSM